MFQIIGHSLTFMKIQFSIGTHIVFLLRGIFLKCISVDENASFSPEFSRSLAYFI